MEENVNNAYPEENKKNGVQEDKISELKEKINVDQAAIDEARSAVGDDAEKIEEYLINNRGL